MLLDRLMKTFAEHIENTNGQVPNLLFLPGERFSQFMDEVEEQSTMPLYRTGMCNNIFWNGMAVIPANIVDPIIAYRIEPEE